MRNKDSLLAIKKKRFMRTTARNKSMRKQNGKAQFLKAAKRPVSIYPMMPRDYTAVEREQLRTFEKKIMGDKGVKID